MIYTIGYAGIPVEDLAAFVSHQAALLCDIRFAPHEKSRWVPHSLLWGGKRAARRAATISVWPTKQAPMPFMT